MKTMLGSLAIIASVCFSYNAIGQDFPSRPIHMVVPQAPGGPTDAVARAVGQQMAVDLGQPVVIDNRPGAQSNLGNEFVVRAAPDGYTLLFTTSSLAINQSTYGNLQYDAVRDFSHIGIVGTQYQVLVATPNFSPANLQEMIQTLKADPKKYNYGSSGGTTGLITELFHSSAGVSGMTRINYNGNAPLLNGLLSGDLNYSLLSMDSALPYIRDGRVRPIAVTSPKRDPNLPDVPSIAESVPDAAVGVWFSVQAPKGVPRSVVMRLNQALNKAIASPAVLEMSKRFPGLSLSSANTPEETEAFVRTEVQRWASIVKAAGLKQN
jgi:tripartite-type tricarboxylate transporter receptor subunit TctC